MSLSPRDLVLRGTLLAVLALGGCARMGPPAPVIRGGGSQYAPPVERQASLPPPQTTPRLSRVTGSARSRSVVVAPGQTIYSIARDTGVPLRALIDANGLRPPFAVTPGQRLVLPMARYHIVQRGDTLYGIARKYGVGMRAIIQANRIPPPYGIVVGQRLTLPVGGQTVAVAATGTVPPAAVRRPVTTSPLPPGPAPPTAPVTNPPPAAQTASLPPTAPASLPSTGNGQFIWPVNGRVVLGFGTRAGGLHNDGINIAAPEGAPIRAAADGVVAYAGNELQGFGNLLLIRHAGDMMTAYAHASIILVKRGQHVRRGQVVARVGHTGNVSIPQLHFEIRRHDKPVDPTEYLTRLASRQTSVFTATASRGGRRDPE